MPQFDESECADVEALLEPYLDGDLPAPLADRLRGHLERCPDCAALLALAAGIRRTLRALPSLDPPPQILDRVQQQVLDIQSRAEPAAPTRTGRARARRMEARPPRRAIAIQPRSRRLALASLAAAAALVALLAASLLSRPPAPARPSQAEVDLAARQARYALAYVGKVGRQASLTLRDDVLARRVLLPATLSAARPLHPTLGLSSPTERKGT